MVIDPLWNVVNELKTSTNYMDTLLAINDPQLRIAAYLAWNGGQRFKGMTTENWMENAEDILKLAAAPDPAKGRP